MKIEPTVIRIQLQGGVGTGDTLIIMREDALRFFNVLIDGRLYKTAYLQISGAQEVGPEE